ncbi:hypothetical protein Micbo1qcDRAFT_163710, partial [Microdochium bolleyi]
MTGSRRRKVTCGWPLLDVMEAMPRDRLGCVTAPTGRAVGWAGRPGTLRQWMMSKMGAGLAAGREGDDGLQVGCLIGGQQRAHCRLDGDLLFWTRLECPQLCQLRLPLVLLGVRVRDFCTTDSAATVSARR